VTAAAAILTPYSRAPAQAAGEKWRKKLLPVGQISYKGRTLQFTPGYLSGLVQAFNDRAYDQVPFQLAGDENKHTNDVERFGGQITGMDLQPDGLYIDVAPTERGKAVLSSNPGCGVSARIVEAYDRSDGKFYPKAIQHVLATLDPRIPGLGTWQAVETSNVADVTYDLSGGTYSEEEGVMPELNQEQQDRLQQLLALPPDKIAQLVAQLPGDLTAGDVGQLNGESGGAARPDGEDELTDEELDAIIDEALDLEAKGLLNLDEEEQQPEPVASGLSNEQQLAVELAQATGDENARQLGIITAQLDHERWEAERRKLTGSGVPPFIADLAQPLLEGAGHTVDLANGNSVDAGQIMRRVLTEYAKLGEQLGIGVELGTAMDEPDSEGTAAKARDDVVSQFREQAGL
jgi:hypothetical protein